MARFPLQFQATDQQGNLIISETVTLTLTGTTTTVTCYEASSGGTAITDAQLTTDSDGWVKYWIDEDDYTATQFFRLTLTGSKFVTQTIDDVVVFPATSADAAAAAAVASAAAALVSENNAAADEVLTDADATATAADVVSTNADVVLTNADVVLTGLDVVSTGNDVTSTNADVVLTGLDVVSTGNDVTSTNADVVSTNADVVLTNADVVLTNADVATTAGKVNAVALQFTYSDTTAMADPGAGTYRLNNATIGSVTAIAFDDTSADTGNPDVSAWLLSLDGSTNTAHYGTISIRKKSTSNFFAIFSITGATTDNAGWTQFAVTYVDSNGTLTDADECYFHFDRTGNVGGGGTMSNLVEDTTPQLGGDLDLNGKSIDFPTTANISDCLDEDAMGSNSATKICTQQSIKAYVDTQVATQIANLVEDTTPQLGGDLDGQDNEVQKVILKDYAELTVANGAAGTTETLDITAGNVFKMTLDENITFTFSNPIASDDLTSFTLILIQDGSGTNTVTWPASVDWEDGTAPTLITTAGTVSILAFFTYDGGTIWHGMLGSSDSS